MEDLKNSGDSTRHIEMAEHEQPSELTSTMAENDPEERTTAKAWASIFVRLLIYIQILDLPADELTTVPSPVIWGTFLVCSTCLAIEVRRNN